MTTVPSLNQYDWDTLVLKIMDGNCVLMLGPDAVHEIDDAGKRRPVLALFAEQLWSELPGSAPFPKSWNSFQVAQAYRDEFSTESLRLQAERFFAEESRKKNLYRDPLENLVALPFPLIVTTLPGDELECVLDQSRRDYYDFRGKTRQVNLRSDPKPLVYHLYGFFEHSRSLVLSENDLLDFLVRVIRRDPALPDAIKGEFGGKKCFLFLGFGLRTWYLRIFLHAFYEPKASYALEVFDQPSGQETPEISKHFYQLGQKIHFFDMDLDDFAAELRRRCDERKRALQCVVQPAINARKIFICHASEDKPTAKALEAKLAEESFEPWLDARAIEPGERWEDAIEKAIDSVDYFIVLQSKALGDKEEGWVFKEIGLALDRESKFQDRQFVIPVKIDESPLIKKLSDFQAIELSDFDRLVTALNS